jgi:outer membrane murein-binding lipoprotein Lpp
MLKYKFLSLVVLGSVLVAGCASDQALADTVDAQASRIAELERQSEQMTEQLAKLSEFDLAIAQFVMDTAGFHTIDDALADGEAIDPQYIATVSRVHKVLTTTTWPGELETAAGQLIDVLAVLQAALEADDASSAATLAATAHSLQHDFSHDIDVWIGGEAGEHEHDE